MIDNNNQETSHWMSLGKSNKEDYATKSLAWATESNQSDRHLSGQLNSSASLFITVGSGFFALAKDSLGIDERIFIFVSIIFFASSLCAGIIYSFQLTRFFENECKISSEGEGIWANLVRSKTEYDTNNDRSQAVSERMTTKSPQISLYTQALFLVLGLFFSFVGIALYLFV